MIGCCLVKSDWLRLIMQNVSNNLLQLKISKYNQVIRTSTRSENMAAKVTPTKCYQRDSETVCRLCGGESVRLQLKQQPFAFGTHLISYDGGLLCLKLPQG